MVQAIEGVRTGPSPVWSRDWFHVYHNNYMCIDVSIFYEKEFGSHHEHGITLDFI